MSFKTFWKQLRCEHKYEALPLVNNGKQKFKCEECEVVMWLQVRGEYTLPMRKEDSKKTSDYVSKDRIREQIRKLEKAKPVASLNKGALGALEASIWELEKLLKEKEDSK